MLLLLRGARDAIVGLVTSSPSSSSSSSSSSSYSVGLEIEGRLDAAVGSGSASSTGACDFRLRLFLGAIAGLPPPEAALDGGAGMHGDMLAAPNEALAHSLGSLERGAQSAMSEEVLVPQAKSSSEVPAMRKRSPATKDAAAAAHR